MNAEEAVRLHREWKDKFRTTMATREKLDAAQISSHDACPFGHWLHSQGRVRYGGLSAYEDCLQNHAKFHEEAGRIAQAVNDGQLLQADRMLDQGTPFARTSEALAVSVIALFHE
jgi:methyl-accepting chemotaxis protein